MPTTPRASTPDADTTEATLDNRLFFRLFQVGNTLERQTTQELGITQVQWGVLGALSRPNVREGMLFSELADYLGVSRQNLDGVLKRMARDGHVDRVPDALDRRAKRARLTRSGHAFWTALQPRIYEFYRQALQDLGFDSKVSFVHGLNQLNKAMKQVKLPPARAPRASRGTPRA